MTTEVAGTKRPLDNPSNAEAPAAKKPALATVIATPADIKKQIEYYLSDQNLKGINLNF